MVFASDDHSEVLDVGFFLLFFFFFIASNDSVNQEKSSHILLEEEKLDFIYFITIFRCHHFLGRKLH